MNKPRVSHSQSKYEAEKVEVEVGLSNGTSLRKLVPLRYRKVLKKCLRSVIFVLGFWSIASFFLFRFLESPNNEAYSKSIWAGWVIVLLLGMVWSMGAQLIYYMRYFYDIDDRTVIIRKGIIAQSEITLPFSKITDVYVNQDLLDVFFGLYDVHISTPTQSSGDFAHLDGLDKRGAFLIRAIVLERIHKEDDAQEHA
jgi:uncharacterized membrane protein YdbT with pleckstrin-like domain